MSSGRAVIGARSFGEGSTCGDCGMDLQDAGEFHPHLFCVLVRAGLNPWAEVLLLNEQFSLVRPEQMPAEPPLVRDLYRED